MGTVGDAYDNAMDESFFASLETELIGRYSFQSKAQARMAILTWIEDWYNPAPPQRPELPLPRNFERSQQTRFNATKCVVAHGQTSSETTTGHTCQYPR